jgi:hypothetical protein
MKKKLYVIVFLLVVSVCQAEVPKTIVKRYRLIISFIKENKVKELANLVSYPLKRQNPIKDIANAKEFFSYYASLIDNDFKRKLTLYADSDIFEHNFQYGLVGGPFNGDIWLNEDGKITAINYSSHNEKKLLKLLTKKIQSQIYPTVNSWDKNILVCKSKNLLIRIDETTKGLRYISWRKGHPISSKPDLVLYHGVEEAQGTMGGWTWTFKNGDWTYIIDDVEMCETDDKCGLFLRLVFKDSDKGSIRLTEIK